MYANPCNICQQFKNRKTIYVNLPSKNITELKKWDLVYVYLVGLYRKSIRQHQTGGVIIRKNVNMTRMKMNDPATGWFEIIEILPGLTKYPIRNACTEFGIHIYWFLLLLSVYN